MRVLDTLAWFFEVPVGYHARSDEEGKKLTARDGIRVLRMLLRRRAQGGFGSRRPA